MGKKINNHFHKVFLLPALIFSVAIIAGCSQVNITQFYPAYDASGSIILNQDQNVYYIDKTIGLSNVIAGLIQIDDIVVAKIRIKNVSASTPLLADLNDFSLKDQNWDIQPRMTFDEVYEVYNKKYERLANIEMPEPQKKYVVSGSTTYGYNSTSSNYSVQEKEDPYSLLASGLAKVTFPPKTGPLAIRK